jgi:XTP/dITP diphosphohydrolase
MFQQAGIARMTSLLIATRNSHKVQEIRAVLGDGFRYLTLADFPSAPAVVEDADTFAGNATKKSVQLAVWLTTHSDAWPHTPSENGQAKSGARFVLADDSGLEVDELNGAPGVHSARFAALDSGRPGNSSDAENNARLLRLLQHLRPEKRTARFRCVIALTPVPRMPARTGSLTLERELRLKTELYQGTCSGHIGFEARGQAGFGYDPLFIPLEYTRTFAELGKEEKNKISHRAGALEKLRRRLLQSDYPSGSGPEPALPGAQGEASVPFGPAHVP